MAKPMFTLYFVDLNVEKKKTAGQGVELNLLSRGDSKSAETTKETAENHRSGTLEFPARLHWRFSFSCFLCLCWNSSML